MNDATSLTFTPVRITTIKADRTVPFAVYIHFKEQYLEYIKPGGSIEKDKYKKLRRQKITKFFIQDLDEGKYQKFLDDFLEQTLDDPNASLEEKSEVVVGQSETAIDKMAKDPGNEVSFNMTRKAAKNLQKLVFENPEALTSMFGQGHDHDPIVKHSVNVCVLAIKFGKSQKLSDENIDYLSTAALMHDIGLMQKEDDIVSLFDKYRKDMDHQEKTNYAEHCRGIIPLLRDKPYINSEIIELIEYHEENLQGTGPHKIKKLSKTLEILSFVNTYDKICITKKQGPAEAMKTIMLEELGNYNLKLINDFKAFLKAEKMI